MSRDPREFKAFFFSGSCVHKQVLSHGLPTLFTRIGSLNHLAHLFTPFAFSSQVSGMQHNPAAIAADQAPAELLARLAEAEALLAAERASNQALSDELLRARSEKSVSVSPAAAGARARDNSSSNSVSAAAATEEAADPPPAERARRRHRGDDERPRPPWQNVLYKRQPYADNHVPDSFLEKLVTNGER